MEYKELYRIQDEVLESFKKNSSTLYFTGGTLLNRFYCEHRYSDDLDFFGYKDSFFKEQIEEILKPFKRRYEVLVDSKNFFRVLIDGVLKVDFCNDYIKPIELIEINGIKSSSLLDILTNKLCAVIDRDEYKDVVDIVSICMLLDIDFNKVLALALQKQTFELEHLIFRLKTFPFELIELYKIKKSAFLDKDRFLSTLFFIADKIANKEICQKRKVLELIGEKSE